MEGLVHVTGVMDETNHENSEVLNVLMKWMPLSSIQKRTKISLGFASLMSIHGICTHNTRQVLVCEARSVTLLHTVHFWN